MGLFEQESVNDAISGVPLPRSGSDWVVLDQSPINGKISLLATDRRNAGRLYAAGQGIFCSDDFGQTWSSVNNELQPRILVVDSSRPDRLYVVSGGSIWKSVDAGATWSGIAGPPNSVTSFLVDAAGTLYAVGSEGAFKSATAGETWVPIVSPVVLFGGLIAADPVTPGVLYASSRDSVFSETSIFKTTDGAASWMGPIFRTGCCVESLTQLATSLTAPITVYLVTSFQELSASAGKVFASRDGGATWELIFTSASVTAIAVDPIRPSVLYAGAWPSGTFPEPGGVYQVLSAGRSSPLGQRGFLVQNLVVAPNASILYAIASGKLATLRLPSHPTPATVPFR